MELAKKVEGTRQVGAEFLTWLMYRSLSSQGILQTSLGSVELWLENRVTFVSPLSGGEVNIFKGDAPAEGREAAVSLFKGKLIEDARLSITHQSRKWEFNFSAGTFAFSAVKVPAILGESDHENVLERFELYGCLEEILRSLYHEFLDLRLDEAKWRAECRRFEKWLKAHSGEAQ